MIKYKEDWYLASLFLTISVFILLVSYFNSDGYLSPDSTNYLSVAQNLINGNGYIIPSDRIQPFAVWPVGYPTLIAIIAFVTGLTVFWASKLLNIILIVSIFLLLRKYYKENAYLVAMIFTWGSYITLYFYTWSETVFILSLILVSISIYEFIKTDKPTLLNYVFILLSTLLLFFSRYIGVFGFGLVGLLGVYYFFNKKFLISLRLVLISVIGLGIMGYILYINYTLTGYPTGMPRIKSPETNIELLLSLIKAFFYEFTLPVHSGGFKALLIFGFQITILIMGYKLYGLKINKANSNNYRLEIIFSIIGIVYLFFIILMRWLSQFDEFSFRLLGPGTILLYIAFFGFLIKQKVFNENKWLKQYVFLFSIMSLLINGVYITVKHYYKNGSYYENMDKLIFEIKEIPVNSSIIFPDKHLKYLRLDLSFYTPYYKPYYEIQETWNNFLNRIDCGNKKLYIYTAYKEIDVSGRFHKSVIDAYESLTKEQEYIEYKCK